MPTYVTDTNILAQLEAKPATGKNAPPTQAESQKRVDQFAQDYQLTDELVRKAQRLSSPTTTGLLAVPATLPYVGGALGWTDAGELNNYITTLKNRLGMDYLQGLKDKGVTLGQVTQAEHAILQSMLGQLSQTGKEQVLDSELNRVRQQARRVLDSARKDYETSFGTPGSTQSGQAPQSKFPTIQALPGFRPRQPTKK